MADCVPEFVSNERSCLTSFQLLLSPKLVPSPLAPVPPCQWIGVTVIICMITCAVIVGMNCSVLALEAYLDYRVKIAAIAGTITTTATTIATSSSSSTAATNQPSLC
ncbi:hypothetical protein GGI35DRAFT_484276 [Trichoderma velutinum]